MKSNKLYITGVLLAAMLLGVNSSYSMEKPETAKITIEDLLAYKDHREKILGKVVDPSLQKYFHKNEENRPLEMGDLVLVKRSNGDLNYGIVFAFKDGKIRAIRDQNMFSEGYPRTFWIFSPPAQEIGQQISERAALLMANFSKDNKFAIGERVVVPVLNGSQASYDQSSLKKANFFIGEVVAEKGSDLYSVVVPNGSGDIHYKINSEFLGKIKK